MKIFFFAIAIGLTLAIGISRVYLGVHWPSDVLAGWTMGAAWALLIREIVMVFQDRGKIDRELETVRSRKMEKGKEGHASGSV